MIDGGFRHLPVMDGGIVAGIISIRDLMRVTLEDSAPRGSYPGRKYDTFHERPPVVTPRGRGGSSILAPRRDEA